MGESREPIPLQLHMLAYFDRVTFSLSLTRRPGVVAILALEFQFPASARSNILTCPFRGRDRFDRT
jgi:hypothetical protein